MDSDNTSKEDRIQFAKHLSLKEMNKYSTYFKLKSECLACQEEIIIKYSIEEIKPQGLKHTCKEMGEI